MKPKHTRSAICLAIFLMLYWMSGAPYTRGAHLLLWGTLTTVGVLFTYAASITPSSLQRDDDEKGDDDGF